MVHTPNVSLPFHRAGSFPGVEGPPPPPLPPPPRLQAFVVVPRDVFVSFFFPLLILAAYPFSLRFVFSRAKISLGSVPEVAQLPSSSVLRAA